MNGTPNNVRDIFLAALKLAPERWPAYLDEACGPDDVLRQRVQNLLRWRSNLGYRPASSRVELDVRVPFHQLRPHL